LQFDAGANPLSELGCNNARRYSSRSFGIGCPNGRSERRLPGWGREGYAVGVPFGECKVVLEISLVALSIAAFFAFDAYTNACGRL
jgi:hypothetical protein